MDHWEKCLSKEKGVLQNEKNVSKEELIVRKNTVRLTVKQELFVKQKKERVNYMDRVVERKIKGCFEEKACLFKGKWITGKNVCSKE